MVNIPNSKLIWLILLKKKGIATFGNIGKYRENAVFTPKLQNFMANNHRQAQKKTSVRAFMHGNTELVGKKYIFIGLVR